MQKMTRKGFLIRLGSCLAVCAAVLPAMADEPAGPTNAIQMVTYFPVPYVQYANLQPQKKLDIGTLAGGSFELTTGSTDCTDLVPFQAKNVNLHYLTNDSVLKISQDFKTTTATFGKYSGNKTGAEVPNIQFHNLYIKSWANPSGSTDFSAIDAKTLKASAGQIKFNGKTLPSCTKKAVTWKTINSKRYLVCTDQP